MTTFRSLPTCDLHGFCLRWSTGPRVAAYAGCFSALASTGNLRRRFPVAAKIALVTAGTIAEVPASPIPPGGSELLMMWTSMAGASLMRSIWYVSKLACSTRPSLSVISPWSAAVIPKMVAP